MNSPLIRLVVLSYINVTSQTLGNNEEEELRHISQKRNHIEDHENVGCKIRVIESVKKQMFYLSIG